MLALKSYEDFKASVGTLKGVHGKKMKKLKGQNSFTYRAIFVLFAISLFSCAPKNAQTKELKEQDQALEQTPVLKASTEIIPRVILLNPPAPTPVEKAEVIEETPPPKAIPVHPQEVRPTPVVPVAPAPVVPAPIPPAPIVSPIPIVPAPVIPTPSKNRPPQFIMFAFDNCTENERWKDLASFSKQMRELDKNIEFTFFLSGVNFIPDQKRKFYKGPLHAQGASNIGFGGSFEDVETRTAYVHKLYSDGHELASHAVGHFSGTQWSKEDWVEELLNFKKIFTDNFLSFGYKDASKIASSIVGFRAPYLDKSAGLFPALKSLGYRYDTSDSADYRLWPKKNAYGLWQFPLFELTIVGNGNKSISMDYNFFVNQSKDRKNPENDPENEDRFADEMMQTYMKYFKANYFGNRAPLSIGHHFFPYQRGVYNRVLKQFAKRVCGLAEVKCVKYTSLANYLDSLPSGLKEDYQAARFQRLSEYPIP